MTFNETSFVLPKSIIAEDVDAYGHLRKYIKLWKRRAISGAENIRQEFTRQVTRVSGSRPPKLSVSITINQLVHFGPITVETDSIESFVRTHYSFWITHNFSSDIFFPSMISNKNDFQWDLLCPPQVHYCRGCWCIWASEKIHKTVKATSNLWCWKYPSRVHPTSDKGHLIISCSSNNTPIVCNTERGEGVIRLKKEGKIKISKVTRVEKSNNWIGMR